MSICEHPSIHTHTFMHVYELTVHVLIHVFYIGNFRCSLFLWLWKQQKLNLIQENEISNISVVYDSSASVLAFLSQAVLGYHFRDDEAPHDCLKDAMIPMQIVLNTLEHGLNRPITIEDKKVLLQFQFDHSNLIGLYCDN